ncbi:MAG: hypothetical protein IJZ01_02570 [Paraprevotella sp.]|nr:hypothetical protein [Paraprevotella sp.]
MKKKNYVSLLGFMAFGLVSLSSCGGNDGEFTKSAAEDALEEMDVFEENAHTVKFETGYYEMNDADYRLKLLKLAANEVITYKAEQINEYIPATRWRSARVKEHVFVTVQLTDKGEKYVIEKPSQTEEEAELVAAVDTKEYPEDKVLQEGPIPVINPQANENAEAPVEKFEENHDDAFQPDDSPMEELDEITDTNEYLQALAKININSVYVLTQEIGIYKVMNLVCNDEMKKSGTASCDFIIEATDVTPFGRILKGVKKGTREKGSATFKYYIDKGWHVERYM